MKLILKKYALCFLIVVTVVSIFCSCSSSPNSKSCYPVEEKSYFDGYEIKNDRVRFRYAIYFVNELDSSCEIALYAVFKESELSGWVMDDAPEEGNAFEGLNESCSARKVVTLKSHESRSIVFTFEGKYLGGKVNENLSFPDDLILLS